MNVEVRPSFRPQSPVQIADSAFEVCRRAPASFLALSIVANLPLFATIAAVALWIRERGYTWGSVSYFAGVGVLGIAVAFAALVRAVGTGALAHAALTAIGGRTPSAFASLRAAVRRAATLGAVSAVRLFAVVMGAIACLVPGVFALGMFSQAPHLVMAEDLGVTQSLVRSARLSTQAARGTFAATLLAVAMMLVGFAELAMTVELALFLAGAIAPAFPVAWAQRPETAWVLLALTVVLAAPPVSAASALALLDARIRAEGLDLELRSEAIAGEPLSFAPVEDLA